MANVYIPEMLTNCVFIKTRGSSVRKVYKRRKKGNSQGHPASCCPWIFAGNGTMGKSVDPGARPSEFESGFSHQSLCNFGHLIFLCLSFFICKVRIAIASIS